MSASRTPPAVTKKALLSPAALTAWGLARYRLRHNARYSDWTDKRRLEYCLGKAFDAALSEQDTVKKP